MNTETQTIKTLKEVYDLYKRLMNTDTGLTYSEIMEIYGIGRRTAERMIKAILNVTSDIEVIEIRNNRNVYGRTELCND